MTDQTVTEAPTLVQLIENSGVARRDVAATLGKSASHVSRVCAGEYTLDVRDVMPLAALLGTTVRAVVEAACRSAPPQTRNLKP